DDTGLWVAVHGAAGFPSSGIAVRTAKEFTGPWSKAAILATYAETDGANKSGLFCYAAKEHPEFGKRGELMATYACNATDFKTVVAQPELYRPRVRRIALAGPASSAKPNSDKKAVPAKKKAAGKKPAAPKARRGRDSNP
ncbi:MAG: hypothetical protein NTX64_19055, partial [Elusimicrobia bacterium]|nr:hypothetical protein [Elusimicrobiota bacterium]